MSNASPESNFLFDPRTAVYDSGHYSYPDKPPFHPPIAYPEYPFDADVLDEKNYIYDVMRQLFLLLGLDPGHYDTTDWNPLGEIIQPGDNVVLKPNLVISEHPDGIPGIQASVVHGSIIRAFLDYVFIANRGQGRIAVADSPIKEVEFDQILELTGIGPTVAYLNHRYDLSIDLVDFRDLQVKRDRDGVMISSRPLAGDPEGYQIIDLSQHSMLTEIAQHAARYRSTATVYENSLFQVHNLERNLYSIPNRILQANVIISLAKLKTHRKAGVTLSLKNMVGITNEKRWLPHHRVGSPRHGGDLYADSTRLDYKIKERAKDLLLTHSWGRWGSRYMGMPLLKSYQKLVQPLLDLLQRDDPHAKIEDGDWYGNDTVWRMVLDLNTLLFYADRQGVLRDEPQRRYLSLIDGIIGGVEEGPLKPHPQPAGLLVAGFNPVAVDMVSTRIMGFDFSKIPMIQRAAARSILPLGQFEQKDIQLASNDTRWSSIFETEDSGLKFPPSRGWLGHIELE